MSDDNHSNDDHSNETTDSPELVHVRGAAFVREPNEPSERLGRNELASVPQTFARWSRTLEAYGVELELGASVLDDWRKESSAPTGAQYGMPHVVSVACVEATRHLRAAAESLVRAQVELGKIDAVIAASIAKR